MGNKIYNNIDSEIKSLCNIENELNKLNLELSNKTKKIEQLRIKLIDSILYKYNGKNMYV